MKAGVDSGLHSAISVAQGELPGTQNSVEISNAAFWLRPPKFKSDLVTCQLCNFGQVTLTLLCLNSPIHKMGTMMLLGCKN